jgi:hypothetical protein
MEDGIVYHFDDVSDFYAGKAFFFIMESVVLDQHVPLYGSQLVHKANLAQCSDNTQLMRSQPFLAGIQCPRGFAVYEHCTIYLSANWL